MISDINYSKNHILNSNYIAIDDQRLKSNMTNACYIQIHDAEVALDSAWDNLVKINKNIKKCIIKLATWSSTSGYSSYNSMRRSISLLLQNNDTIIKNALHNQAYILSTSNNQEAITWNLAGPVPLYRSFESNRKANNFVWTPPIVDNKELGLDRFTNMINVIPEGIVCIQGDWLTKKPYLKKDEIIEMEQVIHDVKSKIYLKVCSSIILGSNSINKFIVFDPLNDTQVKDVGSNRLLPGEHLGIYGNDITLFNYDIPVTIICDSPGTRIPNLLIVKEKTYPFCGLNNEKDHIHHSGYDMDQIINEFNLAKEYILISMNNIICTKERLMEKKNLATIDKVVMDIRTKNELIKNDDIQKNMNISKITKSKGKSYEQYVEERSIATRPPFNKHEFNKKNPLMQFPPKTDFTNEDYSSNNYSPYPNNVIPVDKLLGDDSPPKKSYQGNIFKVLKFNKKS